jgi:hypothetical protein
MDCSFTSVSSGIDDSLFGTDGRDMLGGAFLPALIGSVFIIKFPAEYSQPDFSPDLSTVSSIKDILQAVYGVSLTRNRLVDGLSKFLKLLSPTSSVSSEVTSSDSPKFRDVLNAATEVNVNTCTKIIFLKLASSKSDAAGASAKANPSRNMKRKTAALDENCLK